VLPTMSDVALTLTQPWATLVIDGAKRIETRSWRTPHRGRLGIHAAKGFPVEARATCMEPPFAHALGLHRGWEDLPRGALLGFVELIDCVPTTGIEVACISEQEHDFGDYGAGRWAWLLGEVEPLPEPIPMRGALSLWKIKGLGYSPGRPATGERS
jgi:hypothetical protein